MADVKPENRWRVERAISPPRLRRLPASAVSRLKHLTRGWCRMQSDSGFFMGAHDDTSGAKDGRASGDGWMEVLRGLTPKIEFPFAAELRGYRWSTFRSDALAGTLLALISVPQAIGFALILGLPPLPVVFAVIVGGFFASLFFTSRHHVFGPTSSASLIVATAIASATAAHQSQIPPLQLAVHMALIIGVVQFFSGLFRFGEVTKFISRSVVVAYSTAIGLILAVTQARNLFGLDDACGNGFLESLGGIASGLWGERFSWWDTGIGLGTLLVAFVARRFRGGRYAGLYVLPLLACGSWAWTTWRGGVDAAPPPFHTVSKMGVLQAGWPEFAGVAPSAEFLTLLPSLLGGAVAIALIGMLEAASITKGLATHSGQRVNANQELMGMGVGNIANSIFGAVPGSSSFTRSAAAFQAGAKTQMASMFSSGVALFALFCLAPLFNHIPLAALSAVLVQIGVGMVIPAQIRVACRSTRSDAAVFALTLATALFVQLDIAIYAGIGLSLVLFLQKTSAPMLVEYSFDESGSLAQISDKAQRVLPQIAIIHVEGELFFGAADVFLTETRQQAADENIRLFILRLKNARHLDASTIMALESLHESLKRGGRHLLVSGCTPDVMKVLRNSGILKTLGPENVFEGDPANPNVSTRKALLRACGVLGSKSADIRIFYDRRRQQASTPSATPDNPPGE